MLPEINLLPKIERQSSVHYIIFLSGLLLCLILIIALFYFYLTTRSNLEEVNQSISQLEQENTAFELRLKNLGTYDETNLFKNAATYAEHQIIPTSIFIDELIVLLPDHGYLSNYSYNNQGVEIETQFETMTAVAAYVEKLNSSDFVENVQVDVMNAFDVGNAEEGNEDIYNTIPRYTVSMTINVDVRYLILEAEGNE